MSSALPAATLPSASISSTRETRSPRASACAAAPAMSPAPMMPIVVMNPWVILVDGMSPLTGKVALVTGGSRGIGLATARALLTQGGSVAITATDQARLESAARELAKDSTSSRVLPIPANVRNYAEAEMAVAKTAANFGGLDILINNA